MILRTIRRHVGTWLAGLFLLAQIAGFAPLVGVHLQHIAETQRDVADDLAATGIVNHVHNHHADHGDGRHDHGADNPADQCCMLHHHLAGVVPVIAAGSLHGYPIAPLLPRLPRPLIEAEQSRLERPPRLPLTV